jgi:hypothetical protein
VREKKICPGCRAALVAYLVKHYVDSPNKIIMLPYLVKFTLNNQIEDHINFQSNEKPFKGEVYTIQDTDGKLWDARVTEVTKFIVRTKNSEGVIQYQCKVEKHEVTASAIGFGKRS